MCNVNKVKAYVQWLANYYFELFSVETFYFYIVIYILKFSIVIISVKFETMHFIILRLNWRISS